MLIEKAKAKKWEEKFACKKFNVFHFLKNKSLYIKEEYNTVKKIGQVFLVKLKEFIKFKSC